MPTSISTALACSDGLKKSRFLNLRHRMIDYKGLGMAGTAELWGGVDKLEAKIKWVSFDAETLTMAASPFQSHSFQVRGNLEQYTSQGVRHSYRSSI